MSILQFFDFFYLMRFSTGLYHSNTFVLLLVSIVYLLTFENESKSVNIILFAVLYLSLLKSIAALKFHTFCNSFMNTGFKFLY